MPTQQTVIHFLSFLALLVTIMPFFSCSNSKSFVVDATYRSTENPNRLYHIHTEGTYPPGADQVEAYTGHIEVNAGTVKRQLTIHSERFTPMLEKSGVPLGRDENVKPIAIDADLIAIFIMAVDTTATPEQADKEAEELFSVLELAGLGPKTGLPETTVLALVSNTHVYK